VIRRRSMNVKARILPGQESVMSQRYLILSLLGLSALLLSGCAQTVGPTPAAESPTDTPFAQETATATSPPVPTDTRVVPTPDLGGINPDEIVTLLPPDAIPAIWDPAPLWATVEEAEKNGEVADEVHVIGVAIGDEARAYPIPFLSAHEIVNDTVGGRAIAVTW
jgi:hypothetical protein